MWPMAEILVRSWGAMVFVPVVDVVVHLSTEARQINVIG